MFRFAYFNVCFWVLGFLGSWWFIWMACGVYGWFVRYGMYGGKD